ncbi:MAG: prepilin-type N-terminal cleavage/methylation domain-containing protein [Myxococcota bacterium]|jgi:prepilin-type N-terminal cleavage/methylation domain-containing protein
MTHRRRSGFTLTELAICLSLLAILVPMVYAYGLGVEDRILLGAWHLQTADATRTIADSIQLDDRAGAISADAPRFAQGDCTIDYAVADRALSRTDSCGSTQVLARDVVALSRQPGGISVVFSRGLRADRSEQTTIFIAAGSP